MRFIHTADWHLGKVFYDHALIEDQEHFLGQLGDLLEDPAYRALLIAGDIYDRSIPSPEAVRLFGAFLGKLKSRRPELSILVIPGNHDSSSRLGFGKELFIELGIHLVTEAEDACRPVILEGTDGERYAFFLLPFLHPGSLRFDQSAKLASGEPEGLSEVSAKNLLYNKHLNTELPGEESAPLGGPIRSQGRLAMEAAARLEQARHEVLASGVSCTVLGAHCFIQGGIESESERVFLGTAERVPAELFGGFDYVALGHLHRFQRAGGNAWYSGSPLAYSFGEAGQEKVFLSVELGPDGTAVEPIPVRPLRSLRRLTGSFNYFFRDSVDDPAIRAAEGDYLELILTDTALVENPLPLLRHRFPRLLSISQAAAFAALKLGRREDGTPVRETEARTAEDYFGDFLLDIYGAGDGDTGERDREEKLRLFRDFLAKLEQE